MGLISKDIKRIKLEPAKKPALVINGFSGLDKSLLAETSLVTAGAICAVKILQVVPVLKFGWLLIPIILVAAYVIPTSLSGREFISFGLTRKQMRISLKILIWTSVVVFPVFIAGLWLVKICGFAPPLKPIPPTQNFTAWLIYQFMYVAVAEEVFFRGYVLNNIVRALKSLSRDNRALQVSISIVLSAVVFALAHIIVQGQGIGVLTFLPGLVLGWLFVRTRTLLAPVLFHGLANTVYYFAVDILV